MMDVLEKIIVVAVFLVTATAAAAAVSAAPWLPTRRRDRQTLLDALPLQDGARVCDLGCGDGTLVFACAERNPRCRAEGVELFILPYLVAQARRMIGGNKYANAHIRFGSLFRHDVSDTDVVLVFLMDKCYPRLMKKFAREVKDDAIVVVEAWPFAGLKPERIIKVPGQLSFHFYRGRQFRG